jgi:hypothetical protein
MTYIRILHKCQLPEYMLIPLGHCSMLPLDYIVWHAELSLFCLV